MSRGLVIRWKERERNVVNLISLLTILKKKKNIFL